MSEAATTTTITTEPAEGTPAAAPAESKTFTQAELEAELGKRLTRERAKLLKHGDPEELARKAAEFDKLAESQKTELERAVENAKREAAEAVRAEVDGTWKSRVIRSEVKAIAAGKLADPADALALLDLSGFELDDEGHVDEKGIAAAIDALIAQKPYLAAGTAPAPRAATFDAGARSRAPSTIPLNGDPLLADLKRKVGIPD